MDDSDEERPTRESIMSGNLIKPVGNLLPEYHGMRVGATRDVLANQRERRYSFVTGHKKTSGRIMI